MQKEQTGKRTGKKAPVEKTDRRGQGDSSQKARSEAEKQPAEHGHVKEQKEGDGEIKLFLPRFVVEEGHGEEASQAPAQKGEEKEGPLRDPPAPLDGFSFVRSVKRKSRKIDEKKIKEQ